MERKAEFKSEYFDGEMFAMSGGLLPHALVSAALVIAIGVALRGRNCRVAGSDLRIGVSKNGPFFYPDATVYCGEAQLADDFKDTLLNPALVIEVLSPSSEAYDRGKKFASYRKIRIASRVCAGLTERGDHRELCATTGYQQSQVDSHRIFGQGCHLQLEKHRG